MTRQDIFVSVIVPIDNAASYIADYVKTLAHLLETHFKDYEIILVDNACIDETPAILATLQHTIQNILYFRLSRSGDMDIAITVGLDNCIGDFIITLNPLYDPPHLIPEMVTLGQQGYEIVYGVYTTDSQTQQGFWFHWLYKKFHAIFQNMTGSTLPENFSTYRLMSRQVLNYVLQHEDRHRLLKVIPALGGFKHITLNYVSLDYYGAPRKTPILTALLKGLDVIFSSSIKPLRLVTFTAFTMGMLNLLYALYIVFIAIFKDDVAEGWITLSLQSSGMFFLLSLILTILSEYIFRMMESMYKRPLYQVTEERFSNVLTQRQRLNVVSSEKDDSLP
jgi:glycosyltransferase involved in cell wall biosynthesis